MNRPSKHMAPDRDHLSNKGSLNRVDGLLSCCSSVLLSSRHPPILISHTNAHKTTCVSFHHHLTQKNVSTPEKCLFVVQIESQALLRILMESGTQEAFWPRTQEAVSLPSIMQISILSQKSLSSKLSLLKRAQYVTCKPGGWNERRDVRVMARMTLNCGQKCLCGTYCPLDISCRLTYIIFTTGL